MNLLHLMTALCTISTIHANTKRKTRIIRFFSKSEDSGSWRLPRTVYTGPSTTVSLWTRRRGPYISSASWRTPYKLGSSDEWHPMHKNPAIEYNDQWYEFIYSTEESDPYYSNSWQRTSAVWLKIRNTRKPETSYEKYLKNINRARRTFDKEKRAKKHQAWLARNEPRPISDEDYRAYLKKIMSVGGLVNGTQSSSGDVTGREAYSLLDDLNESRTSKLVESHER